MRLDPDSRAGRAVAVTAPLMALLGGVFLILIPLRAHIHDLTDKIDADRATLARLEGVVAFAKATPAVATHGDADGYLGDYLQGEQDALVVADLQNRLRAMAIARGTELNSANALPGKTIGPHSYLGLRIVLRGHLRDVQSILHTIESGTPLLFVDRVVLRLDARPVMTGDPALDAVPALLAELDIYGARAATSGTRRP